MDLVFPVKKEHRTPGSEDLFLLIYLYFLRVDQFMDGVHDQAFEYEWRRRGAKLLADDEAQYASHWFPLAVIGRSGWALPNWVQIREYICGGCGSQLEVEAVPRGCPPDFEFLPDLDTFYREWLGRPLPDEAEFEDRTLERIGEWSG